MSESKPVENMTTEAQGYLYEVKIQNTLSLSSNPESFFSYNANLRPPGLNKLDITAGACILKGGEGLSDSKIPSAEAESILDKNEISGTTQSLQPAITELVMRIADTYGKRGNCVYNSYCMAKILLAPPAQLENLTNILFSAGDLLKNKSQDNIEKYMLPDKSYPIKIILKEIEEVLDLKEYNTKFEYDFSFSTTAEAAENIVQDIYHTLSAQPANRVYIAENEDHNYLYVVNNNKEVFIVDADLGFILDLNQKTIPAIVDQHRLGLFDDGEAGALQLTLVGQLNPGWAQQMANVMQKDLFSPVVEVHKTDSPLYETDNYREYSP